MKRLFLNQINDLSEVVKIMMEGGIVAYPTDTIYGIGCRIFAHDAIERIFELKGRSRQHPLSILVNYIEEIERYAYVNKRTSEILKNHLPGPFTFILKATPTVPLSIRAGGSSVGIRIPEHNIATKLADFVGEAIITTSINCSGNPALTNPDEIEKAFGNEIDILLDAGIIEGAASTVVDLTGDEPKVVRQGAGIFKA